MIKEKTEYKLFLSEQVNVVQTRASTRRLQKETKLIAQDAKSTGELKLNNLERRGESVSSVRYITVLYLTKDIYWQIPLSQMIQWYAGTQHSV